MFAFIREYNDDQSGIDIFNNIENILGFDIFKKLFIVILTDNGLEFSNPFEIEYSKEQEYFTANLVKKKKKVIVKLTMK